MKMTTLCYLEKDEKYLMLHRTKKVNDENHDKWIGVGGKFEDRESPEDCMKREILEETGLTVLNPTLCGVKQFPNGGTRYIVFLFKADSFEGELRSSEEGNIEWVPLDKLQEYNTVSDLKELLDVMLRPDLNEFQYIVQGDDWIVNLR